MMESSEPVPLGLDYHGTPAEQLQNLFHECGVSPDKLQELMQDLPPVDFARSLVDWFFEKFNHVRYPIDELLFRKGTSDIPCLRVCAVLTRRKAFDELYENQSIEPRSVIVLPLVYIALAIATRIAPDDLLHGDDHRRSWSLRMYWNCQSFGLNDWAWVPVADPRRSQDGYSDGLGRQSRELAPGGDSHLGTYRTVA